MESVEFAILDWIQQHLRCGFLDTVLPAVSWICNHGEVWIILAAVLLLRKRDRWVGVSVALALVLDLVCCNLILKPLVDRVRPFAVNTAVELLTAPPLDASFPSGHTAASFAAVFALKASGSRLWKPALVPDSICMSTGPVTSFSARCWGQRWDTPEPGWQDGSGTDWGSADTTQPDGISVRLCLYMVARIRRSHHHTGQDGRTSARQRARPRPRCPAASPENRHG